MSLVRLPSPCLLEDANLFPVWNFSSSAVQGGGAWEALPTSTPGRQWMQWGYPHMWHVSRLKSSFYNMVQSQWSGSAKTDHIDGLILACFCFAKLDWGQLCCMNYVKMMMTGSKRWREGREPSMGVKGFLHEAAAGAGYISTAWALLENPVLCPF